MCVNLGDSTEGLAIVSSVSICTYNPRPSIMSYDDFNMVPRSHAPYYLISGVKKSNLDTFTLLCIYCTTFMGL